MNIVSDVTDWHDMISGRGLTTGAGCEAILDPTLDSPDYGQYLTTTLENIRVQSINQRQGTDPNRHSTPHSSRDSMFNTDLTMISKFSHQGITGTDDLTQFPQHGQPQVSQGGPLQAGPSNAPPGPSTGGLTPDPQDPANLQAPAPPPSTQGLLAVSQPGPVPSQLQPPPGLTTYPVIQPVSSTTAPVVGHLGPPGAGQVTQPVTFKRHQYHILRQ